MVFFRRIRELFKRINTANFKIVSVDEDNQTGLILLSIGIEGKCAPVIPEDPLVILKESSPKAFSKEDRDKIIDSVLENQKRLIENKYKNKLSLINHQFSEQLEEPLIVYKDFQGLIYLKPARDIYYNVDKLKLFHAEDSACIGNMVGHYEAEIESILKDKNKNERNNVVNFDRKF